MVGGEGLQTFSFAKALSRTFLVTSAISIFTFLICFIILIVFQYHYHVQIFFFLHLRVSGHLLRSLSVCFDLIPVIRTVNVN